MGRLATLAEEHYRKFLPETYKGLTDPETFFRNLETEAEQQIDDLADQLAGPDLPQEDFLVRAARLRTARQSAEELVIRETVLIDPATVETERAPLETDYPSTTDPLVPQQPQTPEDRDLAAAIQDYQDAATELAEMPTSLQPPQNQSGSPTPDSPPTA